MQLVILLHAGKEKNRCKTALLTLYPLQTLSGPTLFRDQPIPFFSSPVLPLREHLFPSPGETQYKLLTEQAKLEAVLWAERKKVLEKKTLPAAPSPHRRRLIPPPYSRQP